MTLRYSANLSMLWTDRPPLDRFSAAASAGFSSVEMLFPQQLPFTDLLVSLEANSLNMSLFDFNAGDWEAGERGIAALPERAGEFRDKAALDLELARTLGTKTMTVLAGVRPANSKSGEFDEALTTNLRYLGELAAPDGIVATVEAINHHDVPGFHVNTVDHAARIVAAVDLPNVLIQFDQYHVSRELQDPVALLETHFDRVGHVQIADAPGRHEPGTGSAPVFVFLEELDQLGYEGRVGLEYVPSGDTDLSLGWLAESSRRL